MKRNKSDKATLDAWLDDPVNYRWKYFYFNPKDKRIIPSSRRKSIRIGFGGPPYMGWTINFANPFSVIAAVISSRCFCVIYSSYWWMSI